MSKCVCGACGGTIHGDHCLLCEMFEESVVPSGALPSCWPMESDALAVHPNQVQSANERAKRHGITGVHYQADGKVVIADRGARKKLLRLEGFHDNSGGYGD